MQFPRNLFLKRLIFIIIFLLIGSLIADTAFCISTPNSKKTIVIDPGHGGFDTGAKGADRTLEKDISLLFAKMIKTNLEKKYAVILTRTDDYWIDTRQRTEIANNAQAVLMISIHATGSFVRETKGLSLIYYKPYITDKNQSNPLQTKWHQTQEKYRPLSRLFAKGLFKRFSNNPNHNSPRFDSLPISFLAGANMPAILLEIGHLTNPFEEKQLNNPDFLSDYAKEISNEISAFLEKHPTIY